MMDKPRRKKYLNNADLLREIHKSKMSFCWLLDDEYSMYDYIVFDESEITEELLEKAQQLRIKRLNATLVQNIQVERSCGPKKSKQIIQDEQLGITEENTPLDEVVIRVITDEHIPTEMVKGKEEKIKTNFESFKHYIVDNDGELCEVARSHWFGDLEDGEFTQTSGRLTNELGKMFIKLAEQISHKGNYRNYTYVDEMRGFALTQLVKKALLFKESKFFDPVKPVAQLNPFAYYTSFIDNTFFSVLNTEKRVRNTRDDLLEAYGFNPSHTRQVEIEMQMIEDRKARRGTI